MWRVDAAVGAVVWAGGLVIGTILSSTQGLPLDPAWVLTNGIGAGFAVWLLWRGRERDREHAAERTAAETRHREEREQAWRAYSTTNEKTLGELVQIRELLRERLGKP